jgi:hypothetical protein
MWPYMLICNKILVESWTKYSKQTKKMQISISYNRKKGKKHILSAKFSYATIYFSSVEYSY